jgi:hypothetical protein
MCVGRLRDAGSHARDPVQPLGLIDAGHDPDARSDGPRGEHDNQAHLVHVGRGHQSLRAVYAGGLQVLLVWTRPR